MDLLGGYGSGSDSEPEGAGPASGGGRATLLASPLPAAPHSSSAQAAARAGDAGAGLPAPSGNKAPLLSGLPKPAPQKRIVAMAFRAPITFDRSEVKEVDEDELPARKRQKSGPKGASLASLLPPPKHSGGGAGLGGAARLDTKTGGSGAGGGGRGRKYDSDDDDFVPGAEDGTGMVDLRPGEEVADGNEAFRVDAGPVSAAPAVPTGGAGPEQQQQYDAAQYEQWQQWQQYQQWQKQYQQQGAGTGGAPAQAGSSGSGGGGRGGGRAAAAAGADPAEAILQAALAAERQQAVKRGEDPFAAAGIQFKEVKADDVKYLDPGKRAELTGIRNALGPDYEAKLRAQAGAEPSKAAKRRHQISSLYHQAKQQELEQLETRAAGTKSKAETHRKYGW